MKTPTIPNGISSRPLNKEGVMFWANKEVAPMLTSLRSVANYETRQLRRITTAQASTAQWIWKSDPMPFNGTWLVKADVVGTGATSRAVFQLTSAFESTGGTASFLGQTTYVRHASSTNSLASFTVSGDTVSLEVTDDGQAMDYVAVVDVLEARK